MATRTSSPVPSPAVPNGAGAPPATRSRGEVAGSPGRARRRPALIGLGVALTAAGALGASYLVSATSETVPVVVVTSPVTTGDQLTADDLGTASVSLDPTLQTVPGDQLTELVGQYATVDLLPGSLLTSAAVAPEPRTPTQASTVGVVLTPAQMPSEPLTPGSQVLLVETPATGETLEGEPLTTQAQVLSTSAVMDTNQTVVNVALEAGPAAPLAARAAAGRVALVLLPPGTTPGQVAQEQAGGQEQAATGEQEQPSTDAGSDAQAGAEAPAGGDSAAGEQTPGGDATPGAAAPQGQG